MKDQDFYNFKFLNFKWMKKKLTQPSNNIFSIASSLPCNYILNVMLLKLLMNINDGG